MALKVQLNALTVGDLSAFASAALSPRKDPVLSLELGAGWVLQSVCLF
jgi:hypothetical protein